MLYLEIEQNVLKDVKCTDRQNIFYFDVVSLYPTVNALDDYAIGFRKYVDIASDDILNNNFIGLVKCDITPPTDLYIPVYLITAKVNYYFI